MKRSFDKTISVAQMREFKRTLEEGNISNVKFLDALKNKKSAAEIKLLLAEISNVNSTDGYLERTLLHSAISWHCELEVIQELLRRGANVNAQDKMSETPLLMAVVEERDFALVPKLLAYGADVNAPNRIGDTALYRAVSQFKSLNVIKVLLKYGADINIPCDDILGSLGYYSILHKAIFLRSIACAQLLIKFILTTNFVKDFKQVISLKNDERITSDSELSGYVNECICEILRLKKTKVSNNTSLFYFAELKKDYFLKPLYTGIDITPENILENFPIFSDIIIENITLALERGEYMLKLRELEICSPLHKCKEEIGNNVISLNFDCLEKICSYLNNDELRNFFNAFSKTSQKPQETIVEHCNEPTPSCSWSKERKKLFHGTEEHRVKCSIKSGMNV